MVPILEAISCPPDKVIKGGSTKPWKVLVKEEHKLVPYVVKLYTSNNVEVAKAIAKEVFVSRLATEFGLDTPRSALINFGAEFLSTLSSEDIKELENIDNRLKFGCKLIDGCSTYSPATDKFLKNYDLASIFAFDNLTVNADRSRKKPNILIFKQDIYLIDHEISLSINAHILEQVKNQVITYRYRSV